MLSFRRVVLSRRSGGGNTRCHQGGGEAGGGPIRGGPMPRRPLPAARLHPRRPAPGLQADAHPAAPTVGRQGGASRGRGAPGGCGGPEAGAGGRPAGRPVTGREELLAPPQPGGARCQAAHPALTRKRCCS